METSETTNTSKNDENKIKQRSTEKEQIVRELIEMGFSKLLVMKVIHFNINWDLYINLNFKIPILKFVDNAGDVPKDIIVEQLLTTNSETIENIPVVEDDGDQLWEDVTASIKMVIVINIGLKMSVGKIASQVIEYCL